MLSIIETRGWGLEKVTRRPAPADSNPSGIGGGDGCIVSRVWGSEFVEEVEDCGCGYVGCEYCWDCDLSIAGACDFPDNGAIELVTTSQSQSAIPPGTQSTAVCGE